MPSRPRLTIAQILKWAKAHHDRTGKWPNAKSGPVMDSDGENWNAVVTAFAYGHRGLPKSSLAKVLYERFGAESKPHRSPIDDATILRWAREHHQREGFWPTKRCGAVTGQQHETWAAIDQSLMTGGRGLAGGRSLARLLADAGCKAHPADRPQLRSSRF